MRNLKSALLATASLGIMSSTAFAQAINVDPGNYNQYIDTINIVGGIPGFNGGLTNLVNSLAMGKGDAVGQGKQFATLTANQFGAQDSIDAVTGNLIVNAIALGATQNVLSQVIDNADVKYGNAIVAFSASGANMIKQSTQITSTDLNSVNVTLAGGSSALNPNLDLRQQAGGGTGNEIELQQVNALSAGYNILGPTPPYIATGADTKTVPAVSIGEAKVLDANGKNTTISTQANIVSINTASIGVEGIPGANNPVADVLSYQKLGQVDSVQANVAIAGLATGTGPNPPKPPKVPIDPTIQNLVQLSSFTANQLNVQTPVDGTINLLGGDQRGLDGSVPAPVGPLAYGNAYANQSAGLFYASEQTDPVSNTFTPTFQAVPTNIELGNAATALTWNSSTTDPTIAGWSPSVAGVGDTNITDVTQVASVSLNSVNASNPSKDYPIDANVVFGGSLYGAGAIPPQSIDPRLSFMDATPFTQVVGYGNATGLGQGVLISSAIPAIEANAFSVDPWAGTPLAGFPSPFDWGESVNALVSGTGAGEAKITNAIQSASVDLNTVNLDNSIAKANGDPLTSNTTSIGGDLAQVAFFRFDGVVAAQPPLQLTNIAIASDWGSLPKSGGAGLKESAKIDDLTQVASLNVNSVTAGKVSGVGLNLAQYTDGIGNVELGNLAGAQSARGAASIADLVQVSSYSANSFNVGASDAGALGLAQVAIPLGGDTGITQANIAYAVGSSATMTNVSTPKTDTTAAKNVGIQAASVGINTATIGSSLNLGSSISQVSAGVNVSQLNSAIAVGSLGASITGLTQAATTSINTVVSK